MNHLHYVSLKPRGTPDLSLKNDNVSASSGPPKLHLRLQQNSVLIDEKDSIIQELETLLSEIRCSLNSSEVKEDSARFESFLKAVAKETKKHLGKAVIFVGKNGVGKSWILNLLLQMTLKPDAGYKQNPKGGEALYFFKSGGQDGKFTKDYVTLGNPEILTCPSGYEDEVPGREEGEIIERVPLLTQQLRGYCEGYPLKPQQLSRDVFLLPSQEISGDSTTPALTTLLYCCTWQLLVYYKTSDQIKREACE